MVHGVAAWSDVHLERSAAALCWHSSWHGSVKEGPGNRILRGFDISDSCKHQLLKSVTVWPRR